MVTFAPCVFIFLPITDQLPSELESMRAALSLLLMLLSIADCKVQKYLVSVLMFMPHNYSLE